MYHVNVEGAGLGQATGTLSPLTPVSTTTPMVRMSAKTSAPTSSTVKTISTLTLASQKKSSPIVQAVARPSIKQLVQTVRTGGSPKAASIRDSVATAQKRFVPLPSTGVVQEQTAPPVPATAPIPVAKLTTVPGDDLYLDMPEPAVEAPKKGLPTWAWAAIGVAGVLGVVAVAKWIL